MTLSAPTITVPDLLEKIKSSLMSEENKKALEEALPRINEVQRLHILSLIEQSNADAKDIEKQYDVKIHNINDEYEQKLNVLVHVEKKRAIDTFEKMADEDKVQTIMAIEKEIDTVGKAEIVGAVPKLKKGRHSFLGFTFIILIFATLIGGAIYVLQHL